MVATWRMIVSISCLTVVIAKDDVQFDKWLDEHGISADSVDYETWKANLEYVEMHNRGGSSFSVTMNKFAHLTPKDLTKGVNMVRHQHTGVDVVVDEAPPESVDWRTKDAVTPVRNQGEQESSHSFAAADTISSYVAISGGKLVQGSADEITDCCHYHPCSGRFVENAFKCVHDIGGLCAEDAYQREHTCACHNSTCTPFGTVKGSQIVQKDSEQALENAVVKQPVHVVVDASHRSFQLYESGVYYEPNCTTTRLDHSMLVVGYGKSSAGEEYWIVKNSWGVNWGMKGYIQMAKNKMNNCGIASLANYPY